MDFQRTLLFVALAFTILLMWQAWQEDYGPKPERPEVSDQPADMPSAPAGDTGAPSAGPTATPARPGLDSTGRIKVHTDSLYVELDTKGGDVRHAELLNYPVEAQTPDVPVTLLQDQGAELFVAQSGLVPGGQGSEAPNHHAPYTSAQSEYRLAPGAETLDVRLTWQADDGVAVTKVYTFHRGDYRIDLRYEVENTGEAPWRGHLYRQLLRTPPADSGSMFLYTYTGGAIYTPEEKYEKIEFEDMAETNLSREAEGGWAAMLQHYFLGAWIPPQDETQQYYSKSPGGNRFILGMIGPAQSAVPGETTTFQSVLYVGPKLQDHLAEIAPGLELAVDYGWLTVLAKPIFWLLDAIHSLLGNWGWSIIVLTLLIKLAFFKLSAKSYKSMAQMRKLQPRLQSLKERYGDDRQKMSEAMMKMYKEEKVNPLSGCLPILVQIPVFIALYWVLLESVELRQADFMLWLNDLSSPDPWFVLPVLMGITMLIQHRLNPTPMDPIQAKVMMILPLAFTVFFAFFPAGLVLYWVTNNTLSIAQQWYITRKIAPAS